MHTVGRSVGISVCLFEQLCISELNYANVTKSIYSTALEQLRLVWHIVSLSSNEHGYFLKTYISPGSVL